jgi:dynein heavy chain 1
MKTIASAIRFGTPLLVNDAEAIDPILNPILNKELQKMGGRTLIRLGNEDIDFSPKFVMILVTRNPFVQLAPDICSRITLVNFTITPASLESQALTALLKAERSDIDTLRSTALKLQGEQSVRIRELEESLLDKISAVQGAILDDDSMIITLENIQKETFELNKEVFNTQKIMEEVHTISNYFEPLASSMASVYFSMEKLNDVNFLYKFNLHFFLDIISNVLNNAVSSKTTNSDKDDQKAIKARVKELSISFFKEVFRRVLRSLKFHDKILFSARLCQIYMSGILNHSELNSQEMDALIKDTYVISSIDSTKLESLKVIFSGLGIEESAFSKLINLTSIPVFSQLFEDICKNDKLWREFIVSSTPELVVPDTWIVASDQINQKARAQLLKTILIKYLRPDRITQAIGIYITEVFGSSFNWRTYLALDFDEIILKDSKNNVPIMLCSEAGQGQDVSGQIEKLSLSNNKVLLQVAMGSSEGYGEAEKSIAQAVKSGQWVLLRNTHLCIDWMEKIEKKISSMTPHAKFRIFLTCEINEQLPPSLLSASDVVYIEASSGIKTSMIKFFNSIPTSRFEAPPVERSRLYLLLAWLNAIVFERLRYVPLGWTKRYEFNEADSLCALDIIDQVCIFFLIFFFKSMIYIFFHFYLNN